MATFREAIQAKQHLVKRWKKMPGVVGIGIGFANGKDRKGGACIVLYTVNASASVKRSCPRCVSVRSVKAARRVAVPVRTITSGPCCCHIQVRDRAFARQYRGRIRPVIAGYSVGYPGASGTAGLIVQSASRSAQRYLFSNNHVLNKNNTGGYTETIQPGGADGGRSGRDRIGRLYRFVRLRKNGVNYIDAALSIPTANRLLAPRYATVGVVRGHVRSYGVGNRFKKVGRTTGRVSGVVESIHTDIDVDYGNHAGLGTIRFRNQTVIRGTVAVSLPGDSGSVWLTESSYAAAVNFAGSADGRRSIAFPIQWAMQAFGIRVARAAGSRGQMRTNGRKQKNPMRTQPLSAAQLGTIVTKRARKANRRKQKRKGLH
ncbi:hypothetical protein J31TS6_43630 [Brevibacillus reuszeri]|uniref:hypothetical protein n=1 Tax=Brevibacillus reuszeri TaxID=54915 RepID=UPI001B02CEB2|nr:hypothetical protein [Brevibacillus reuszeri]GIO08335.1 hypothetical protein J31TS6_43630 [Brevibacillus reuszeri]